MDSTGAHGNACGNIPGAGDDMCIYIGVGMCKLTTFFGSQTSCADIDSVAGLHFISGFGKRNAWNDLGTGGKVAPWSTELI